MSLDDDDESEDGTPRPKPPPAPPGEEDKAAEFGKYAEAYYTTLNVGSRCFGEVVVRLSLCPR